MIKPLALFVLLLVPCRDYPWVPLHEALRQADVVLTAQVVELPKDAQGRRTVVVRPDSVLKGDCPEKQLTLPIHEIDPHIGCQPPRMDWVQGGRFLLLLVRKPVLREIHPQFCDLLPPDSPTPKLVPVLLDLLAGKNTDQRIQDLAELVDAPHHHRCAYEAIDLLTRRQARMLQSAARRYFQAYSRTWRSPADWDPATRDFNTTLILQNCRYTMDFKFLEEVRAERRTTRLFLNTASRVCGRPFTTTGEFDAWWGRAMKRAYAGNQASATKAMELIPGLRSADARSRSETLEQLLDLGPSILPQILPLTQDADADLKATATSLEDELRLLSDFGTDLLR